MTSMWIEGDTMLKKKFYDSLFHWFGPMKPAVFLSLLMLSLLFGCIIPVTADSDSRILIDGAGREVTIPSEPDSFISLYPGTTRLLVAFNKEDAISGLDSYSKRCPIMSVVAPSLQDTVDVGNPYSGTLSLESIAFAKPDVIVMSASLKDMADSIQTDLNIPVVCFKQEFGDYSDLLESITLAGDVVGDDERAKELNEFISSQYDPLTSLRDLPEEEKPFVLVINQPHGDNPLTVWATNPSGSSNLKTALDYSGAINAASDLEYKPGGSPWRSVSLEQIMNWNPDYLFIHPMGNLTPRDILELPDWKDLQAVKNKNVYKVCIEYVGYDPAQMAVQSMHMGHIIHPEKFTGSSFNDKANEVFAFVYNTSSVYNSLESKLGLSRVPS